MLLSGLSRGAFVPEFCYLSSPSLTASPHPKDMLPPPVRIFPVSVISLFTNVPTDLFPPAAKAGEASRDQIPFPATLPRLDGSSVSGPHFFFPVPLACVAPSLSLCQYQSQPLFFFFKW